MSHRVFRPLIRRGSDMSSRHEEEGLLMLGLAVVLTTILSLVAITITSGAVSQLRLSENSTNRNSALEGALAGIQTMVANIRAASSNGYVMLTELPCSNISGSTNASGGSSFVTSVQYQDENSQGTYTSVSCTTGSGPATPASGSYLARAVITSCSPSTACPLGPTSAVSGSGWRRVVSTYDFNTSYANVPGGLIYSYSGKECFEASYNDGTDTSSGVTLAVTTSCSNSNALEQFQYTSNWNLAIELGGVEYCVQDSEDQTSPVSSPIPITTPCTSTAVAQWGINDVGGIQGVSTSGSPSGKPNTYCLDNPLSGDPSGTNTSNATLGGCDGAFDNTSTWMISSQVGAGASQPPTGQEFGVTDQLVNFEEFGDCLDVTNANTGSNFLIDYMCKQFPDTTDYPVWNQRWCFQQTSTGSSSTPVGVLYTPDGQTSCTSPSSPYCLQSPLSTASNSSTAWVTVTSCNLSASSQASNLLWTEWGSTGGMVHEYTWTDADGYCLEANTSNKQYPSGNGDEFSTIQVDTCTGAYEQKWNAPSVFGTSQIVNTHESTGSGTYTGP